MQADISDNNTNIEVSAKDNKSGSIFESKCNVACYFEFCNNYILDKSNEEYFILKEILEEFKRY